MAKIIKNVVKKITSKKKIGGVMVDSVIELEEVAPEIVEKKVKKVDPNIVGYHPVTGQPRYKKEDGTSYYKYKIIWRIKLCQKKKKRR